MLKWLVGLASVAVIAAVGYFFWMEAGRWLAAVDAERAEKIHKANEIITRTQCQRYVATLRQEASDPSSVTSEQKEEAVEGRINCLSLGII